MVKLPDISKLSPKELQALIEKAKEQQEESRKELIERLKNSWLKEAEEANVTIEEVLGIKKTSGKSKGTLSEKPCEACGFKTEPPHDGRRHRWTKGFEDKPFTAAKLSELGLKRV